MKTLIITDDSRTIKDARTFFDEDFEVETAGNRLSGKEKFLTETFDVAFYDLGFLKQQGQDVEETFKEIRKARPGTRIIILAKNAEIRETMDLIKAGADDYLCYPVDPVEIRTVTDRVIHRERRAAELEALRDEFWDTEYLDLLQTESPEMSVAYNMIKDVAPTKSTVLLTGETGVGKGVLARVIHQHSTRKDYQFVHVHCGAIPENLIESELFGHEKGAFTGAIKRKLGRFELANNGTIFLDEISTLTPAAQIKLLQVMQDSVFQRVGGESDIHVNVRIVAATNEDLKSLSDQGEFRSDLFYRLNVFPIEVPALRSRVGDLPHIIDVFLRRLNLVHGKQIEGIQPETIAALQNYTWPGNVRELENLVERAYIIEKSGVLTSSSFPLEIFKDMEDQVVLPLNLDLTLSEARSRNTENFERQYLTELLAKVKGKVGVAADKAGISVRQLNNLMNKYKLYKEDFKDRA